MNDFSDAYMEDVIDESLGGTRRVNDIHDLLQERIARLNDAAGGAMFSTSPTATVEQLVNAVRSLEYIVEVQALAISRLLTAVPQAAMDRERVIRTVDELHVERSREYLSKNETETHQITMAKASQPEIDRLVEFMQVLEEKAGDGDEDELLRFIDSHGIPPWERTVFGYQTLVDNACDPEKGHLDWRPDIKRLLVMSGRDKQ